MGRIKTVNDNLKFFIDKVQEVPELNIFSLAGGTNLALRFDHRESVDIDLFTDKKLKIEQFKALIDKLLISFRQYTPRIDFTPVKDNRLLWFRMFLAKNDKTTKFDIVQNIPFMFPPENFNGIKMLSSKEIALMKIESVLKRGALKDIYDLNYLTSHIISLPDLWNLFRRKRKKFGNHVNTFTISQHWDPLNFFDALADIRKEFNPPNLEKAFEVQEDFISISEALKQWKHRVKNTSINLNHDTSQTR